MGGPASLHGDRRMATGIGALILSMALATSAFAQAQEEIDRATEILHAPQTKTSTLPYWAGYYRAAGDNARALEYYTKMKALYLADDGPQSGRAVWAASNMSMCLQAIGQTDKAKTLAAQCLKEIREGKFSDRDREYVERAGGICEAILSGKSPDPVGSQEARNAIADAERQVLAEVDAASKKGAYSQEYAQSLVKLARMYRIAGKYAESARSFKSAVYIIDNMAGPFHPILLPILKEYAMVLEAAGNKQESAAIAKRVQDIASTRAGAGADTFAAHMQTGADALRSKDLLTAEKEITQACATAASAREKVLALNALAQTQLMQSKLDEAEKTNKTVLELQDKQGWQHTLDYAGTVTNMAEVAAQRRKPAEAARLYEQSIAVLKALKLTDRSQNASRLLFIALNHMGLAKLAKTMGDAAEAEKQMGLAKQAVAEHNTVPKE